MLRHPRRRLIAALCLLLLVLLSLDGCGQPAAAGNATLRIPILGRLYIPDPAAAEGTRALFLDSLTYSSLVRFGPDLHVIPDLAVAIPTITHHGREYVFTIRHGVHFADGHRVTAHAVARSFAYALGPAARSKPAKNALGDIVGARAVESGRRKVLAGITILNRLSLRITLLHPDPDFLAKLALPPADVVERRDGRLIGSGPWQVWRREADEVTLRPSHYQYQGRLSVEQLILRRTRTARQALDLYRRNAVDVAPVPFSLYNQLAGRPAFVSSYGLVAYYLVARGAPIPRADGDINTTALTKGKKGLTALTSIVPPAVPDYVPAAVAGQATFHRLAATVIAASGRVPRLLEHRLRGQLADGLATYRLVRVSHTLPDPRLWLGVVPAADTTPWFRYTLSRASNLVEDPVTRMNLYSGAEGWALRRGLVVPLASENLAYLIRPDVQGLNVTPYGLMPSDGAWASVNRG